MIPRKEKSQLHPVFFFGQFSNRKQNGSILRERSVLTISKTYRMYIYNLIEWTDYLRAAGNAAWGNSYPVARH